MSSLLKICVLLCVIYEGVNSKFCNDCVRVNLCPSAASYLDAETVEKIQLLRYASCGFELEGRKPIPKVCCSIFPSPKTNYDVRTPKISDDVEHHANLKLLPTDCGNIKGDRIFGGSVADMYEFPWMAIIAYETRNGIDFKCGGSIINKRYILTAAHCIVDRKISSVRVGEHDLRTLDMDCQRNICEKHLQDLSVEDWVIHGNYKSSPTVNDIALIRLGEDIDFNHRNVHRICLPITSRLRQISLTNKMVTVTGWGFTENFTEASVLRKVVIPVQSAQRCSYLYNRFSLPGGEDNTAAQFCAGVQNKDSCSGDSGGPAILEVDEKYIQYGIVSNGPSNCGSEIPGVYTDVTKYMKWILDNIYA